MSGCCNTLPSESGETPEKRKPVPCPVCGQRAMPVETVTVLHHVRQPWSVDLQGAWWVCENPDCEQAYIGEERRVHVSQMRDLPAGKQTAEEALVCFCFGVSRQHAKAPSVREFVVQMTRDKQCDCTIRNPAGRCCLKDFPRG